jgi:hypothetical protein
MTSVLPRGRGAATVAVLVAAGVIMVAAGCGSPPSAATQNPLTPPVTSGPWPNPSAPPEGDLIATGIASGNEELVLAFWRAGEPHLMTVWRDRTTGALRDSSQVNFAWYPNRPSPHLREVLQLELDGGRLVEFGIVRGGVGKVVIEHDGQRYDARLAPWSVDGSVLTFWHERPGTAATVETPDAELPTVVLYDASGAELDRQLLKQSYGHGDA